MNNELTVFENEMFGKVRVIDRNGEPWFIAADVCKALELEQVTNIMRRLDVDEKALISIKGITRGNDNVNIINEFGLYNLVLTSRKPEAKEFKRWVTHEVIPAIRKHGGYLTPTTIEKILNDPDTIIRLATQLKTETAARLQAENKLQIANEKIRQDEPKVKFANALTVAKTSCDMSQLATMLKDRGIDIGTKRLWDYMRDNGFIGKRSYMKYKPTQKSLNMGLMEYLTYPFYNRYTHRFEQGGKTMIKGKGQIYFVNRMIDEYLNGIVVDEYNEDSHLVEEACS